MSDRLNKSQVEDLIIYCGSSPTSWKNDNMLICCPVHGESHASLGVSVEKQICHCFSCGFAGNFSKLLAYSLPEQFGLNVDNKDNTEYKAIRRARDFLKDRYELEYHELGKRSKFIKRYGAESKYLKEDKEVILPKYKLAPLKSGKETFNYFFQRGFGKDDLRKFMVGRDLESKTITFPIFNTKNELVGIIGRYVTKRLKNQRYKIYNGFERSNYLYPLNIAKPSDTGEVILVEGILDAIKMHKLGYTNTYAFMTVTLSSAQIKWLCKNCDTVIWVGDNDKRGLEGREKARALLKNKITFKTVEYPSYGKDPCDWNKEDIDTMINSAKSSIIRKLKRM